MFSFGQAGLGAGRCNSCICYLGVTRGGDNFLCLQHCITYATVFSLGQAGLGAGGCNGCICYLGVTSGRIIRIIYFFFTIELLSTQENCDRIYIFSALCTGCIDAVPICSVICCSGDCVITVLALRRNLYRSKAAIRRNIPLPYGFCFLLHSMTNSRDGLLCLLYPTAF